MSSTTTTGRARRPSLRVVFCYYAAHRGLQNADHGGSVERGRNGLVCMVCRQLENQVDACDAEY